MVEEEICTDMDSCYLQGQEICEADKCVICRNGEWEEKVIA